MGFRIAALIVGGLVTAGPIGLAGSAFAQAAGSETAPAQTPPVASPAPAADSQASDSQASDSPPQTFAFHAQATVLDQANASFHAPYQGPNSLWPHANGRETADLTLYAGARLWKGAEVWINPEVDQGFGLASTLGLAAFPSGEAYKVGASTPYPKLPRLFLRQTIGLGGGEQKIDPDQNVLGGATTANRIVLTLGKFSVVDIFDANAYAHDPRGDFMNWAVIDAATFDYAANAWGYTYGAAAELYWGRWAIRGGAFDLSDVPNNARLDPTFGQFQLVGELEERHTIAGQPGKLRITSFVSRARMATFADAIAWGEPNDTAPQLAPVRRYRSRTGISFDAEQQLTPELGAFLRGGLADGTVEPYEFTDMDRSLSGGLSLKGARWGRKNDVVGLAGMLDAASSIHLAYLAAGGLGILVGDGRLPHPGPEAALETFYDIALAKGLHVTFDYQYFANPAFNRDRGPVSVGAIRLHGQF
ncbi:MAG TPA: carbohydrate porin [Caulobacteraceae bacterium]|jgi:high affinity Mn2+ porin|nr:carbohydrate porin [Caulobacteraceae bacterium]